MFDTEHFDSEATDVLTEIGEVYADEFDAPVTILTASLGDGMIIGQLMSGGNIYNYAADGNEIGFDYSPEDSEEVNEYARGFLESSYGIKTDSMDSPYEYAFGFVRLDAQVKCKKGGVACGKVCLPKGAKCKKYSGAGNAGAMSQAAGRLKSPGRVAAGIGAGLAGAAAVAGGAGYLAYKNRDKLGEPGRKLGVIGTRVKAAAREGKEEFMSGVNNAKEILKAGQKASKSFMSEVQGDERLTRKEKYKANQLRKSLSAAAAGGGASGAVGAVAAGTENAINAVKYNLTRNPKFGSGGSEGSSGGGGGNALPPGKKGGAITQRGKGEMDLGRQQMKETLEDRVKSGIAKVGEANRRRLSDLGERDKAQIDRRLAGSTLLVKGIKKINKGAGEAAERNLEANRAMLKGEIDERTNKRLAGSELRQKLVTSGVETASKVGQKLLKGREQRALPPAREESFPVEATARAIVETNKAAKTRGKGMTVNERAQARRRKAKGK